MATAWLINGGLLESLDLDPSALPSYNKPNLPGTSTNAFFKIYVINTQQAGIHEGMKDAGGDPPDVRLFNERGHRIGHAFDPGKYIFHSTSQVIWAGTGGENPHYTLFSANEDALCIAFATASWPKLGRHFGWVGDWGQECAGDDTSIATWYFSKVAVPGTEHFPNCLWVDQDGSQPATGFQVNWLDMQPVEQDDRFGKKAHDLCHTPSFQIYQHWDPTHIVIHGTENKERGEVGAAGVYHTEPTDSRKRKKPRRSVAEAKLAFERKYGNMLVIDDLASHTARDLCESTTSAGPNFVNPEHGYYCDMTTKAIHPVCPEAHDPRQNGTVCFDMGQNELVGPGLQKRSIPFKVQDWRNSKIY